MLAMNPTPGQMQLPADPMSAALSLGDPLGAAASARGQNYGQLSPAANFMLMAMTDGGQRPLESLTPEDIVRTLAAILPAQPPQMGIMPGTPPGPPAY